MGNRIGGIIVNDQQKRAGIFQIGKALKCGTIQIVATEINDAHRRPSALRGWLFASVFGVLGSAAIQQKSRCDEDVKKQIDACGNLNQRFKGNQTRNDERRGMRCA